MTEHRTKSAPDCIGAVEKTRNARSVLVQDDIRLTGMGVTQNANFMFALLFAIVLNSKINPVNNFMLKQSSRLHIAASPRTLFRPSFSTSFPLRGFRGGGGGYTDVNSLPSVQRNERISRILFANHVHTLRLICYIHIKFQQTDIKASRVAILDLSPNPKQRTKNFLSSIHEDDQWARQLR